MRLIKFRAYLEVSGLMVDWKYLLEHGGLHDLNPPKAFKTHIMQYTGMEDKNGVEIYEGDIVKFNNGVYEIRYWQQAFRYKHLDDGDYIGCIGEYLDSGEVIGNIYQNEELLKESE